MPARRRALRGALPCTQRAERVDQHPHPDVVRAPLEQVRDAHRIVVVVEDEEPHRYGLVRVLQRLNQLGEERLAVDQRRDAAALTDGQLHFIELLLPCREIHRRAGGERRWRRVVTDVARRDEFQRRLRCEPHESRDRAHRARQEPERLAAQDKRVRQAYQHAQQVLEVAALAHGRGGDQHGLAMREIEEHERLVVPIVAAVEQQHVLPGEACPQH